VDEGRRIVLADHLRDPRDLERFLARGRGADPVLSGGGESGNR
jgi:hypothetical protein